MFKVNKRLNQLLTYTYKNLKNQGFSCPSCGNKSGIEISRKNVVTALKRCLNCNLMYRVPTSTEKEFEEFYQSNYEEGFTTDMPSDDELLILLENNFVDSDRDYSLYISVLKALNLSENSSLIDYGCSWGYGSWQLQKAGFDVTSFEISKPRSNFAKNKLKINAYSDLNEINKPADIFFTSHVLEHISNINSVIEIAKKLIKPNGYFVAFTPNGSDVYRKFNPKGWQKGWGFVHPICLDEVFYKSIFKEMPILLDSAPYNLTKINSWVEDKKYFSPNILSLDGNELLLIVKF